MADVVSKVCMLGDAAVGKTSLVRRYVLDEFSDRYLTTIGAKVMKKEVCIDINDNRYTVSLMLWDLMGQQEFEFLQSTYYKGAQGGVLVADITRKETLDNIKTWLKGFKRVTGNVPIILVANKKDLLESSAFSEKYLEKFARSINAPYIMTSAKTGENVVECFTIIAKEIVRRVMK